ncbi:hypothetical protein L1I30_13665 [Gillisia sp. M10.2A]|uniref:Uncharacterized protein n=1 Tax=Gillisia lutea TaxID=2909668 RepID=A0ABS9ELP5_9FLAO|nr:hypothetical protein [Gillisia lutea]MCF4102720.1 hypothetical protein [Gillisia lutea]
MNKPLNTWASKEFYQSIGKLFYAVAAIDKKVRKDEVGKLKEIIKKEWVPVHDTLDEFGTDTAYQIEIIFDWLEDDEQNANEAFLEFQEYKKNHESFFEPPIKKLIWKTADSIASAFSGKNKSELIVLSKLKSIL